ncbi:condensation domain-containing protein [Anaeromicropila populeti]|uniref:Uncharacterized protein, contains a NRPS condensation (Elongation) domain n=1 Tax=Anaeromicropila populeti TaxID=37658 RepID=A0A1I6JM07_9FIRM|nr:condensation domain-containing protein [Anaeromicropila populeti]SFR79931.1 Uncharacterized protein, contains a NRPS condensation (elongation) domain [Anaeromicropila populeti]
MITKVEFERVFLSSPSIHVMFVATIQGFPSEKHLQIAIENAVNHFDMLRCRIETDYKGECYYVPCEHVNIDIEMREWEGEEGSNLQTLVNEQQRKPFNFKKGELIRFIVFQNEQITKLVVCAHHLAGDGLSYSYLIEKIMTNLMLLEEGKEDEVYNIKKTYPVKVLGEKDFPSDVKIGPLHRFIFKNINKKWNERQRHFNYDDYLNMFNKFWEERKTRVITAKIRGNSLDKIIQLSKKNGVTVNSTLATTLLKAFDDKITIKFAASVREDGDKGMGNYATVISINHCYDKNIGFWDNCKKVHKMIHKELRSNKSKYFGLKFICKFDASLLTAMYFHAFSDYTNKVAEKIGELIGYIKPKKGLFISNLTKAKIADKYGSYELKDLTFYSPLAPSVNTMLSVATIGHTMVLTMQYDEKLADTHNDIFYNAIMDLDNLEVAGDLEYDLC